MNENKENNYHSEENLINVINTGAKSRVASKKKRFSLVFFAVFIGVCFFAIVVSVAINTVFKITEIEFEGCEYYSEEMILSAIELDKGDSIFFAREEKFAEMLSTDFPMIYSLKVEKEYPSKIKIKITEEIPSYIFEYAGEYAVVSRKGKVLYLGVTVPEEFQNVMEIQVPPVNTAIEGFVIEYRDTADCKAVEEILTKLRECTFADEIVSVEIQSRFDIKVKYGERFTILFGDRTEFDIKLKFVDGIIETLTKGEKGTINVKNPKKGYLIME